MIVVGICIMTALCIKGSNYAQYTTACTYSRISNFAHTGTTISRPHLPQCGALDIQRGNPALLLQHLHTYLRLCCGQLLDLLIRLLCLHPHCQKSPRQNQHLGKVSMGRKLRKPTLHRTQERNHLDSWVFPEIPNIFYRKQV